MSFHNARIGVSICTLQPFVKKANGQLGLDTITVEWQRHRAALGHPTNMNLTEINCDGQEVGIGRNMVARKIVESENPPEFLFFLDNDVLLPFDAMNKLFAHARWNEDHDIFAGIYCCKWMNPPDPLIYAGDGSGPFWDFTIGDILTTEQQGITSVHMGLTLIRTSLFFKMKEKGVADGDLKPFFFTRNEKTISDNGALFTRRGTEDIFFCNLAREVDCKIMVDTSVLAPHIDKATGQTYSMSQDAPAVKRARWLPQLQGGAGKEKNEKKALDIGCGDCLGNAAREWEGHKTYTLDIRGNLGKHKDQRPDYIQDTRQFNLPDNHFDLVASSHHLEHIEREHQERVWKEMFRILKPGGYMEHIVPDITWAAQHIYDGTYKKGEHLMHSVFNVLWGAQGMHGYEAKYNLHYFGYTKDIAEEFCKMVGLVDLQMFNYKDNPRLSYNLRIVARKPEKNMKKSRAPKLKQPKKAKAKAKPKKKSKVAKYKKAKRMRKVARAAAE